MSQKRGKLVQSPTKSIDSKYSLSYRQVAFVSHHHNRDIQRQENNKLYRFQNIACSRNNETVLIEQWRVSRVVKRDGLKFVVIRNDVPQRRGRINDAALVDSRHNPLAGSRTEELLAFRQDGDFQRRQCAVIYTARRLLADVIWSILKRVKTSNKNMGEHEEAICSLVVFSETAQDSRGDELAERGARPIHIMTVAGIRFFIKKLSPIHQQTVN